jgi:predicted small secreted protein
MSGSLFNFEGRNMKKIVALIVMAFALTACNTVRGVGQDIEKAGEAVQKSTK